MKITEIIRYFNEELGKNIYRIGDTIYWQFDEKSNEIEFKIIALEGDIWRLQAIKNTSYYTNDVEYYDGRIDDYPSTFFINDNYVSKIPRLVK